MTEPSRPTVKRLFCLSGNRCAYPGCPRQLVDAATGTVVGKICHIKSRNDTGPRWDASQTDEQRHSFENLILLCGPHHDIIDDRRNLRSFSPEVLQGYKSRHEAKQTAETPASDAIVDGLLANLSIAVNVHAGAVVHGQVIGKVDTVINNFGAASQSGGALDRPGDAELDRQTFLRLLRLLPWDGAISFARNHNFDHEFNLKHLEQLWAFEKESEDPAFEFLDSDLEALRVGLLSAVKVFTHDAARGTCRTERPGWAGVPSEWIRSASDEERERFRQAVRNLNALGTAVSKAYDGLVALGRRKLGVQQPHRESDGGA